MSVLFSCLGRQKPKREDSKQQSSIKPLPAQHVDYGSRAMSVGVANGRTKVLQSLNSSASLHRDYGDQPSAEQKPRITEEGDVRICSKCNRKYSHFGRDSDSTSRGPPGLSRISGDQFLSQQDRSSNFAQQEGNTCQRCQRFKGEEQQQLRPPTGQTSQRQQQDNSIVAETVQNSAGKRAQNMNFKFEIDISEQRRINSNINRMSLEERRVFETKRGQVLLQQMEGQLNQVDNVVTFYVIDSSWYNHWKAFLKGASSPGEIDNAYLRNFIYKSRLNSQQSRQLSDSYLGLKEGDDFIVLSEGFWKFLFDIYGSSYIIKLHYFESPLKPESGSLSIGQANVFKVKTEVAIYDYKVLSIDSRQQRAKVEKERFSKLSESENPHIQYALPAGWFRQWLHFVKQESYSVSPPGEIDNTIIYKDLVSSRGKRLMKESQDYMLVTKEQWYLLFNIYGGGPSIYKQIDNQQSTYSQVQSQNSSNSTAVTVSKFGNSQSFTDTTSSQTLSIKHKRHANLQDLGPGIFGIVNNRYYCYLNAFMQCLAPISELRDHYLSQEYAKFKEISTKRESFDFCNGIYLFFKQGFVLKQSVIEIKHLKDTVAQKFHPILQHDSHEFMAYLLSCLQEEETPKKGSYFDGSCDKKTFQQIIEEYYTAHPSIIDRVFTGIQKTVVACGKCTNNSITYNPFMTLSLTFESSLDKSLQNFLQVDTLGLSNEYKCEKCRRESKAMIHTELSKMPSILTFHLKRFTFPKLKKLTGHCKYPPQLDISRYQGKLGIEPEIYELFALTVHIGSLEMGHYVAYTKREDDWYLFNDERFSRVSEREALSQEAYLLFYRKVKQ